MLRGRTQLATLAGTVDRLADLTRQQLDGAADVRLVGVTMSRTLRNQLHALEQRLAAGATVRIAVIDPNPGTLAEAARRCTLPDSPAVFQKRLEPTMGLLRQLADRSPGRFHVRLLAFVPAVGLILIDPLTEHSRIHVDLYSHHPSAREPSMAVCADRNPHWYRHFLNQFDRIWATGRQLTR